MRFNIKRINILSFCILTIAYIFAGNGNCLVTVTDEVEEEAVYNRKEYHDLNIDRNDFAYDANGNLIYDLDRDIVTIRYNLLNLPDTVQLRDGSQITHVYAADGRKLATKHVTPLLPLSVPLSNVTDLSSTLVAEKHGTLYCGNLEFGVDGGETTLRRIHNTEGYIDRPDSVNGLVRWNYYRKDHLGNNREVWHAKYNKQIINGPMRRTQIIPQQTIQRTRYYPSGLPWEYQAGDSASLQPYKYGGKEFVEAHGLGMYDNHA